MRQAIDRTANRAWREKLPDMDLRGEETRGFRDFFWKAGKNISMVSLIRQPWKGIN
jgi:hypothetical protein